MRIFVPSKNRAQTIRTHKLFPEAIVVVHNDAEAESYQRAQPGIHLAVSNVKADAYGLTRQREWICQNLARPNEWFVFADDNIRSLIGVIDGYYEQESLPVKMEEGAIWRPRFNALCSAKRFLEVVVPDTINYCKKVGAHLAGFATTDNIVFRRRKFVRCGYVIGKLMIWHNTGEIPFDHTISMEDFYHTAMHLIHYGACVVNQYIFPRASHYQPGGMGTYEERIPIRQRDVKELMRRFPGLFRVKNREGFAPNTDLQLRVTQNTLDEWLASYRRRRLF